MAVDSALVETTIVWPDGAPESVGIRGTFDKDEKQWWQKTIWLSRTGKDRYSVTMPLKPGSYEFKFVINSGDWQVDTSLYETVDDGNGNTNNVVVVVAAPPESCTSGGDMAQQSYDKKEGEDNASSCSEQSPLLATGSAKVPKMAAHNKTSANDNSRRSSAEEPEGTRRNGLPSSGNISEGEDESNEEGSANSNSVIEWQRKARRYIIGAVVVLLFAAIGVVSALYS
ncbi:hypothetical protein LPJ53_004360 [Coemansia erecta]|uniref:AMP-activated protein kinase glycogen-binding domain-containing protein n=1 Tax=Coemansia erecta TaxID=147472 RepID=A0A9W7XZ38_9FUNG|nr:hypothetical protein LPJ53_004360 [Coemansia erecta]